MDSFFRFDGNVGVRFAADNVQFKCFIVLYFTNGGLILWQNFSSRGRSSLIWKITSELENTLIGSRYGSNTGYLQTPVGQPLDLPLLRCSLGSHL